MATYQRKSTHTIEATQFTPDLGALLRKHAAGELQDLPAGTPALLVWSEQGGYRLDGAPISFGDYVVGGAVMAREEFEKAWEPVHTAEALLARPSAADLLSGAVTTGSVAVDTVLAAKAEQAQPRTRRTRTEGAQ